MNLDKAFFLQNSQGGGMLENNFGKNSLLKLCLCDFKFQAAASSQFPRRLTTASRLSTASSNRQKHCNSQKIVPFQFPIMAKSYFHRLHFFDPCTTLPPVRAAQVPVFLHHYATSHRVACGASERKLHWTGETTFLQIKKRQTIVHITIHLSIHNVWIHGYNVLLLAVHGR